MDKAVWRGVLAVVAAIVSFLLAVAGFGINGLGFPTPGGLLVGSLTSRAEHRSIAEMMALEFAIDFMFWFALMCALYWLFRRLQRRPGR